MNNFKNNLNKLLLLSFVATCCFYVPATNAMEAIKIKMEKPEKLTIQELNAMLLDLQKIKDSSQAKELIKKIVEFGDKKIREEISEKFDIYTTDPSKIDQLKDALKALTKLNIEYTFYGDFYSVITVKIKALEKFSSMDIFKAIEMKNGDAINSLIKNKKVDFTKVNKDGLTPLFYLCSNLPSTQANLTNLFELFLNNGAIETIDTPCMLNKNLLNLGDEEKLGELMTPLHYLCYSRSGRIWGTAVQILLKYGASPEINDTDLMDRLNRDIPIIYNTITAVKAFDKEIKEKKITSTKSKEFSDLLLNEKYKFLISDNKYEKDLLLKRYEIKFSKTAPTSSPLSTKAKEEEPKPFRFIAKETEFDKQLKKEQEEKYKKLDEEYTKKRKLEQISKEKELDKFIKDQPKKEEPKKTQPQITTSKIDLSKKEEPKKEEPKRPRFIAKETEFDKKLKKQKEENKKLDEEWAEKIKKTQKEQEELDKFIKDLENKK